MKMIAAGEFKAKCLKFLDEVAQTHELLVVTKHGKPVACLTPYHEAIDTDINPLKDSVVFEKDLIDPINEDWEADL